MGCISIWRAFSQYFTCKTRGSTHAASLYRSAFGLCLSGKIPLQHIQTGLRGGGFHDAGTGIHKRIQRLAPQSLHSGIDCRIGHFVRFLTNGHRQFPVQDGSAPYVEYLNTQYGTIFPGDKRMERDFHGVLQAAGADIVDEHQLSLLISRILCRLASPRQQSDAVESFLRPAVDFIRNHYSGPISLEDLADQCRISKPHLIRSFKRYLNCTPHEYLLSYRLRQSKQRLVGSNSSVEEVAEQCGFNSASHFTRAFRSSTGMTPSEFRKLQF